MLSELLIKLLTILIMYGLAATIVVIFLTYGILIIASVWGVIADKFVRTMTKGDTLEPK